MVNSQIYFIRQTRTIVIPHLPDKALSPNSRVHWRARHLAAKAAKEEMIAAMHEVSQPPLPDKPFSSAHLTITFTASDQRRRDFDNLLASTKPYIDGLVEEVGRRGLLVDDSAQHLFLTLYYRYGDEAQTEFVITPSN